MSDMMCRQTWLEVDLDAIFHNVYHFKVALAKEKEVMATVKADGYGHGAVPVAKTSLRAGASWLTVALLEEGIELRQAGIEAPILVMGYVPAHHVPLAQRYRLRLTVPDYRYFQEMVAQLSPSQPPLLFHLKLDTGMGRLGVLDREELLKIIEAFQKSGPQKEGRLVWEGVYSHLATADEQGEELVRYFKQQVNLFDERVELLLQQGIRPPVIHLANSAGMIREAWGRFSTAGRLGISLYGLLPSGWMQGQLPFRLKPALSLHTRLSQVKEFPPGAGISYGCTYRTRQREWIGTIPIGYADGYSRLLSNKGEVLIGGRRYPVVGRVCMDQTMIKLDGPRERGEQVTLIGQQGSERISADDLARWIGTINYEITCMISKRVPRIYTGSRPEVADLTGKAPDLI